MSLTKNDRMKIAKDIYLFIFMSTAGSAIERYSLVKLLVPSIKTKINIPYPTILRHTPHGTLVVSTSNDSLFVCQPYSQDPSKRFEKISVQDYSVQDYVDALDNNPVQTHQITFQDASPTISIFDIETLKYVEQIDNSASTLEYNNDGNQLLFATNQNYYPFAISDDNTDMAVSLTEDFHIYIYDISILKEKLKSDTSNANKNKWNCLVS